MRVGRRKGSRGKGAGGVLKSCRDVRGGPQAGRGCWNLGAVIHGAAGGCGVGGSDGKAQCDLENVL